MVKKLKNRSILIGSKLVSPELFYWLGMRYCTTIARFSFSSYVKALNGGKD